MTKALVDGREVTVVQAIPSYKLKKYEGPNRFFRWVHGKIYDTALFHSYDWDNPTYRVLIQDEETKDLSWCDGTDINIL